MPMSAAEDATRVLARARQAARCAAIRLKRKLMWGDAEWEHLKDAEDRFDTAWRHCFDAEGTD